MLFAFWIFIDIQSEKKSTNTHHPIIGSHFYLGSIIGDRMKLHAYMHISGYQLWNTREGPSNLSDIKYREILFSFTCNVWFLIIIILLKSICITLLFIKPLCAHKILSVIIQINTSIFPNFRDFLVFNFDTSKMWLTFYYW